MNGKNILTKLRDGLKTISPEEFDYSYNVKQWKNSSTIDISNPIGVICGPLGWCPKFIPETGIYWERSYPNLHVDIFIDEDDKTYEPHGQFLIDTFGVTLDELNFMFRGQDLHQSNENSEYFGTDMKVSLQQAINRITYVIEKMAKQVCCDSCGYWMRRNESCNKDDMYCEGCDGYYCESCCPRENKSPDDVDYETREEYLQRKAISDAKAI